MAMADQPHRSATIPELQRLLFATKVLAKEDMILPLFACKTPTQKIVIPASYTDNVEYVKLSFGNPADGSKFYRGAKWNDLCISEVEFWGY